MLLENQVLYEFDKFVLNPTEHCLQCDGKAVPLTPKSFEILLTLIARNGKLVTKDELMKKIWPDSFVEEANLTVNVSALRKALGDTPEHQQYIETVPKLGYRFIAEVKEVRDGTPAEEGKASTDAVAQRSPETKQPLTVLAAPTSPRRNSAFRVAASLIAALLVVAMLLGYRVLHKEAHPATVQQGPRRLAILPFQNVTHDAASDFLGYSLADAVITKLGYVQSLRVRPSYAIAKYRDQVVEIPKVASDLDVDTLLTGNFMREGDDLRITCQLIDVKTQNLLWKGVFDMRDKKLLIVQDQVAEQIIHGLELNLSSSEATQLKLDEPADPLAYEYYLRGVDLYSRSDFPLAIRMLEKSAQIDPHYALTWAYLGRSYNASGTFQLEGQEYYRKARDAFDHALALQPAQIETRAYLANFLTDTGKVEQAVPILREALKSNPSHAELHWELGYAYRFAGMLQESVAECERGRQLDPNVKLNSSALNAYLYLGAYDEFLQSLPQNNQLPFHFFYRGFAEYYKKDFSNAVADFDHSYDLNSELLQAQVGKALSDAIGHQESKGLEILHGAERRIRTRGVGDPEATYKLAQAYLVLGDKTSALRVLRHSIENGFFPYPYFETDPLLDSLRGDPQFNSLIQAARQRHEAFKKMFF